MNAADIAALRTLLGRAKTAGWEHRVYLRSEPHEHVWVCDGDSVAGGRVVLWDGLMDIDLPSYSRTWTVPAASVALVATVLELAGALPAADNTRLIRLAICDPGAFCKREIVGEEFGDYESIQNWGARAVVIALAGGTR